MCWPLNLYWVRKIPTFSLESMWVSSLAITLEKVPL